MTETPFFVTLKNRGLITISGNDRKSFLQGLITNDIKKLSPDNMLYACLLTPQGKFLHDFFVLEQDEKILLDCEGGMRTQDLHRRLSMYKLRADIEIMVKEENTVYAVFGNALGHKDPRHPEIGYRTFTKPDLPEEPFETWDYHRISLTIPDGSRDLIVEKSTMDEGNMDTINAIDYNKGCYVGQELTARMHYRGLGKKHLATISLKEPSLRGGNADEAIHHQNATPGDGLPRHSVPRNDERIIKTRSTCRDIGIALVKNQLFI